MIKMYSKEGCGNCNILKNKLKSKGIVFTEITDEQELKNNKILGLPVLDIDGKLYSYYDSIKLVNNFKNGGVNGN